MEPAHSLLRRIYRARVRLEAMDDHDSLAAAAMRGRLSGLREALSITAINKVIDDVALEESA